MTTRTPTASARLTDDPSTVTVGRMHRGCGGDGERCARAARLADASAREGAAGSLVQRARAGDRAAIDRLIAQHYGRILKMLIRYVRDPSDAEDIAQEAFLKAFRSMRAFRGDAAFHTWMYRIAINVAKNHRAARTRTLERDAVSLEQEGCPATLEPREPDTPERLLARDQTGQIMLDAFEELPESMRTVLRLRTDDEMPYREISAITGCPVGTVRSRLSRARELLDLRLERASGDAAARPVRMRQVSRAGARPEGVRRGTSARLRTES